MPIRVGTDAALALAMANVLVNELGIYDRHYLRQCTNAAYLVKEDGHYVRDPATNKPLVWDATAGTAKTFDSAPIDSVALLGNFTVNGVKAQPGFQILKEHLKKVHAGVFVGDNDDLLRRIFEDWPESSAKQPALAARSSSTVRNIPYRPAAAIYFPRLAGTQKRHLELRVDRPPQPSGGLLGQRRRSAGLQPGKLRPSRYRSTLLRTRADAGWIDDHRHVDASAQTFPG